MENNELQTSPPPSEEVQKATHSKTSLVRRLIKWGACFLTGFIILLACAAVVLQFFFPTETLKPIVERELTKTLKQPVSIAGLEIGLFRGIEIRDVRVGKAPLLKVHSLILDYDLSSLLLGRILINRIILDSPSLNLVSTGGKWNFQTSGESGKKASAPAPAPGAMKKTAPTAASPFPLPLEVDLKHFVIQNIILDAAIDDQILVHLAGLDIKAHGKVSPGELNLETIMTWAPKNSAESPHNLIFSSRSGAGLEIKTALKGGISISARDIKHIAFSGKIQTSDNQIKTGDALLSPNLSAEWNMALSLQPDLLQITNFLLNLGKGNQAKLSGEINKFTTQPEFKLNLQEAVFDLKEILDLVPAKPASADGVLKVANLEMSGRLHDFKPESIAIARGNISLDGFSANYPQAAAKIDGAHFEINLQDIKLENRSLRQAAAQVSLTVNKAVFENLTARNINQRLQVNAEGSDPLITKLVFSASAGNMEYLHPKWGKLGSGLRMEGTAEGDLAVGDLNLFKIKLGSGSFLNASLRGKIKDFGKKDFQLDPSLNLDIDAFLRVLPPEIMKSAGLALNRGIAEFNAHIQGTLDDKFQPQSTIAKADMSLKEVDLQLANPAVGVKNFSMQTTFPLEYNPAKGIKIPVIRINTRFQKIKALDNWEIGPAESHSSLTSQQFLSLAKDPGIVPLTFRTTLALASIRASKPEVTLAGLAFEASARADLAPADKDVRNMTLSGDLSFKNMEGLKKYKTGKFHTVFTVDAHDRSLTGARINLKTNILSPSVKHEDSDFALGEVKLDSLVRLSPEKGDVDIDWIKLDIPTLLNFDAKAQARKWGDTFSAQGKVSDLRLDTLWKTLPTTPANLQITGTGAVDFSAKGSMPGEEALKNFKIPVEAHARLTLNNVSLTGSEPVENQSNPSAFLDQLKVEGLSYSADADLKDNDLKMTGKLIFGEIFKKDLLGEAWLEPEFNYQYALADWNKLVFEKHEFTIKNRGILHTFTGRMEGLKPFITKKVEITPAEIANRLEIALVSALSLKASQNQAMTKNLKADGMLSSRQTFSLVPGKEIVLDGEISFDKFNASVEPSLKVNGITGRFPFNKKYLLNKKSIGFLKNESHSVSQKGFFSQLRNFSAYKNILRIDSINYDSYTAANVGMDLLFKDNQLAAEKFIFDALKGSLGGQLFLTESAKGPVLSFSTEFAGVDFDELIGRKSTGGGAKSQIDGNMQFGFKVSQGSSGEKITIDQIDMKVAITRIGDEALDRILMFLDPEESKPAIVDTRSKLKLAKPHRLSIVLENGNLSVEVWLKSDLLGGIVKAPELKRVPVASLKIFRQISEQLQVLAGLRDALKYLAAQGIEFDEEKGMSLF